MVDEAELCARPIPDLLPIRRTRENGCVEPTGRNGATSGLVASKPHPGRRLIRCLRVGSPPRPRSARTFIANDDTSTYKQSRLVRTSSQGVHRGAVRESTNPFRDAMRDAMRDITTPSFEAFGAGAACRDFAHLCPGRQPVKRVGEIPRPDRMPQCPGGQGWAAVTRDGRQQRRCNLTPIPPY